jgi:hypothetical protein
MKFAILNQEYEVINIIEADVEYAKNYLSVLIESSDVTIGDIFNTEIRLC